MELTRVEQMLLVGAVLDLIGEDIACELISDQTAETLSKKVDEVADNITRNQCAASLESLVKKIVEMYITENDGVLPTELIRMSSETGIRILTTDEDRKMFLMSESQRLGLDMILPPLTADVEFNRFEDIKKILVDKPELVIEKLTGKKVANQF